MKKMTEIKLAYRISVLYVLMVASIFMVSCTKEWDEHYNEENFDLPEYMLFDFIKSQGNLSAFASMLETTGYDTIINASQTFTIWAPTNEALANVNLGDNNAVQKIVQNHIARNRYSVSNSVMKSVRLLSGKYVQLDQDNNQFLFGGKNIIEPDLPAKNGLVHIISNYLPYTMNLWEFIESNENTDSLTAYFNSQASSKFSAELSVEIGVNDDGNPVYDSIFIESNLILDQLGMLDNEDTTYTVLMPNNQAWIATYRKLENYYNIPEVFGGETRKRQLVQWGIVKDIVFATSVDNASSFDSLVSTSGTVFYDPASLFVNATKNNLSNGIAYVTNQLNFPDSSSWLREIRVEAENTNGREVANANIFLRSASEMGISKNRYILVDPTGTSNIALPSVTFPIPNTLSTAYKLYCVFVPSSLTNPNDLLPMKAKFSLTYIQQSSGKTTSVTLSPGNAVTDPNNLTKMYLGEFDFEFANVIDEDYSDVVVMLEVSSNVKIEEIDTYNRSMQIDCVILEPILK